MPRCLTDHRLSKSLPFKLGAGLCSTLVLSYHSALLLLWLDHFYLSLKAKLRCNLLPKASHYDLRCRLTRSQVHFGCISWVSPGPLAGVFEQQTTRTSFHCGPSLSLPHCPVQSGQFPLLILFQHSVTAHTHHIGITSHHLPLPGPCKRHEGRTTSYPSLCYEHLIQSPSHNRCSTDNCCMKNMNEQTEEVPLITSSHILPQFLKVEIIN